MVRGRPGGALVPFSLRNLRVVVSNLSGALAVAGRSPSVPFTGLSKAMVCGALSLGHGI